MIKTILVCISGSETDDKTLELAGRIAKQQNSHIEVLHVRADSRGLIQYTGEGMDGSMIEEILEVSETESLSRAKGTKSKYETFCRSSGITIAEKPTDRDEPTICWVEKDGREDEIVSIHGRLFDFLIIGRPLKQRALPSPITLEAALLDTGRPTLLASPELPHETGKHVAIAWESSPEAAHAIAAAMPILVNAVRVTLLSADPMEAPSIPPEEGVKRLAWSQIDAQVLHFDATEQEIGAAYLFHATKVKADILVKGAYARSRIRQMILGGRTRHIITNTEIPVLLCK